MIVEVSVKSNASKNEVMSDAFGLTVRTTVQPTDGKANDSVIRMLAEYYHVPPSRIQLKRGFSGRKKIFEILE